MLIMNALCLCWVCADAQQVATLQREIAALKKAHAQETNDLRNHVALYEMQLRELSGQNG